MKILIQNGALIDIKNRQNGKVDLLLEDGKVKDWLKPGETVANAFVIDAKGCIVAPGFIDLHTHLREPGFEYKETIETGTKAAAAGGFTSICCMANTNPTNDQASITEYILKKAKEKGVVNVYPIGALTKGLQGKELAQIGELKRAGCVALSDDGKSVDNNYLMRLAMEYAKSFDLTVMTHSVDACLSSHGVMNEGFVSTKLGLRGIPNEAEDITIARDILLGQLTGARLHVAHIATKGGVELIKMAKDKGLPVTCEVTPHHLLLTDEMVGSYDTNAKMMPPLRSEEDRAALVEALASGLIDCIATDHAPHALIDKEVEFDCADCGIVGLETAVGAIYKLVKEGKLSLERFIDSLTVKPARIVGLNKGSLEKGADADVVIFDPEASFTIQADHFYTKSKNSPFIGRSSAAEIKYTIVGGKIVYQKGQLDR